MNGGLFRSFYEFDGSIAVPVVGAVILIFGIVIIVSVAVTIFRYATGKTNTPTPESDEIPSHVATRATVTDKSTEIARNASHLTPDCSIAFGVEFLTENGERVWYEVDEQAFENIEIGQTSTLVTVGGRFFAFGDGDAIQE